MAAQPRRDAPLPTARHTPPPTGGRPQPYTAVILAGGAARRLGGVDKPSLTVGGRTLLDRVLTACPDAVETVVVGPPRPTCRPVRWTREDPPGGGPLPALEAGLREVRTPRMLLLAADLPFLTRKALHPLLDFPVDDGPDAPRALILTDPDGRDQPLVGAYRTESVRQALAVIAASPGPHGTPPGSLRDRPLRTLLETLSVRRLPGPPCPDCDTRGDLAAARERIREHGRVMDEWIAAVRAELGLAEDEPGMDTGVLLDAARDAAHGVTRPAAPLTTFLIGWAAGRHGLDIGEAARRVGALAARWESERAPEGAPPETWAGSGPSGTAEPGPGTPGAGRP
ncbi:NTP transferase domain-containing protein [Streptomyces calidiresistens]|uniref:NTP transferase domain-containing protein n=1 Tax=Streptomyces calidiresistens TaxID=1485586 RepID=A0A7W3T7H8_9ACTN|nr:NTP transferase domain-containing protein [Streptomyces calidiresistens]MBB0232380.1 NTP transferase domain-containing protein [Streptomyces calidiresistens]